jgi:hypothetical protein
MFVRFFAHFSRLWKSFVPICAHYFRVCNVCANFGAGLHESVQILASLHIRVQMFAMNANCRANFSEIKYGALFSQIAHES